MSSEISVDEIIINIVRDNKLIYDKTDANHKKANKKMEIWSLISSTLQETYNVDMSAENVEKRWSALHDMFGCEERRKKLRPSGSGSTESKGWYLYQQLHFLSSHIAHRTTRGSFNKRQLTDSSSQPTVIETTLEEEISKEMWSPSRNDHGYCAHLDQQLAEAGTAIASAMTTVSTLLARKHKEPDGYMLAIEEALKHVPGRSRT